MYSVLNNAQYNINVLLEYVDVIARDLLILHQGVARGVAILFFMDRFGKQR